MGCISYPPYWVGSQRRLRASALANIGIVKVLSEAGIRPTVITGTSAGSLIGAMPTGGMGWRNSIAGRQDILPRLLHGETLEPFCAEHLPATFADLKLPFAAITTELPAKRTAILTEGELASASVPVAHCALSDDPVRRHGKRLKDGRIACVLPSESLSGMGADFIVGSDVWEIISLCGFGIYHHHLPGKVVPTLHITTPLSVTPISSSNPGFLLRGYRPGPLAIERIISAGEDRHPPSPQPIHGASSLICFSNMWPILRKEMSPPVHPPPIRQFAPRARRPESGRSG